MELSISNALKLSIPGGKEYRHAIKLGQIARRSMDLKFPRTHDGLNIPEEKKEKSREETVVEAPVEQETKTWSEYDFRQPLRFAAAELIGVEVCRICRCIEQAEKLMFCDLCGEGYHHFCLPDVTDRKTMEWRCLDCVAKVGPKIDSSVIPIHLQSRNVLDEKLEKLAAGEVPPLCLVKNDVDINHGILRRASLTKNETKPVDDWVKTFIAGADAFDDSLEKSLQCAICHRLGETEMRGRLLHHGCDSMVHAQCAFWSQEVTESFNGELRNVHKAVRRGRGVTCAHCSTKGATIGCFDADCSQSFHFGCAALHQCVGTPDLRLFCPQHAGDATAYDDVIRVVSMSDQRCLEISQKSKAASRQAENQALGEREGKPLYLRLGAVTIIALGRVSSEPSFHTSESLYPVGYHSARMFWSDDPQQPRCIYNCRISDVGGHPQFEIQAQGSLPLRASNLDRAWKLLCESLPPEKRASAAVLSGPEFFGLGAVEVITLVEHLKDSYQCMGYKFKVRPVKEIEGLQIRFKELKASKVVGPSKYGSSRLAPYEGKKRSKLSTSLAVVDDSKLEDEQSVAGGNGQGSRSNSEDEFIKKENEHNHNNDPNSKSDSFVRQVSRNSIEI